MNFSCAQNCHCDYVKYSPVCSADGKMTFLSPCHAGCKNVFVLENKVIIKNKKDKKTTTKCYYTY